MQAINALVLPGLAAIILCATAVMAWLLYRMPDVKKVRPESKPVKRAARRSKQVL